MSVHDMLAAVAGAPPFARPAQAQLHADLLRQVLYTPLLRVHVLVQRRRPDLRLPVLT